MEDKQTILSMIDNLLNLDSINEISSTSVLWLLKQRLNGEQSALFIQHAREVLADT